MIEARRNGINGGLLDRRFRAQFRLRGSARE